MLPLDNLSGDPSQEYFVDGMTEALIGNLARIRALRVVSRTSVMRFKGAAPPLNEIARTLNVDAVLEGSVQRTGDRVRVTVQLIHVPTDAHLWAREYERELTDVLKLQSDVAGAVADEVQGESDRGGARSTGVGGLRQSGGVPGVPAGSTLPLEVERGRPGASHRALRAVGAPGS